MKRWGFRVALLIVVLSGVVSASAQTSTPLPTSTPDVRQMWTLPPGSNDLGTPYPAQDVVFSYSFDAGEAAIALFLGVVIVLTVAGLTLWLIILVREKDSTPNHGGRLTPAAPAPFDRRLAPRDRRDI